jgi:ribosomal protein S18 acetylase RimI-like enzyme
MQTLATDVRIRPANELDLQAIIEIDEKIGGSYRPEVWERRLAYYIRRDPDSSVVAEIEGKVVGFMLGEVRSGEFGLDEPTGWVEVLGVDPSCRGLRIGQRLAEAMFEHFRGRGAAIVRTLVEAERGDLTRFFASLGFEAGSLLPLVKHL